MTFHPALRRASMRGLALPLGALLALAFPVPGLWWLAWFGLVPLFLLVAAAGSAGEAVWRSWLAGAGFFAAFHYWLARPIGPLLAAAAALAGVLWIPTGLVVHRLLHRRPSPARVGLALVLVPAVWLLMEGVRSWRHLGGAWGMLGLSQWNAPLVLQVAALGGVWLLTLLPVAVNTGLAAALSPGATGTARLLGAGAVGVLIAGALVVGLARPEPEVTDTVRIAAVQPGDIADPEDRITAHVALTRASGVRQPDLVVWGQSSVPADPGRDPALDARLRQTAAAVGADVLVNVDEVQESGAISKSTWQYTADGVVDTYDKQRLVPFGEYIPLRPALGWLADVTGAPDQDRVPGDRLAAFRAGGVVLGPLISYESAFPDLRRGLARMGVDLTVVQGSLGTFQGSWVHAQQASMEAVRAVESGRPAVLVEMSGTSAAFDARGRKLLWMPPKYRGAFLVEVPLSREATPYVRYGDWPLWGSALVVALASAGAAGRCWRARRTSLCRRTGRRSRRGRPTASPSE